MENATYDIAELVRPEYVSRVKESSVFYEVGHLAWLIHNPVKKTSELILAQILKSLTNLIECSILFLKSLILTTVTFLAC